jgi:hypothetical protein
MRQRCGARGTRSGGSGGRHEPPQTGDAQRNCGTGKPKANEPFRVHEEPRKAGGTVMAQMRLNARRPGPQARLICLKGNFGACDAAAVLGCGRAASGLAGRGRSPSPTGTQAVTWATQWCPGGVVSLSRPESTTIMIRAKRQGRSGANRTKAPK